MEDFYKIIEVPRRGGPTAGGALPPALLHRGRRAPWRALLPPWGVPALLGCARGVPTHGKCHHPTPWLACWLPVMWRSLPVTMGVGKELCTMPDEHPNP